METDRFYLEIALGEAEQAALEGTVPIGAVVVSPAGQVIGQGRNHVYSVGDFTCHAEIDALRQAGRLLMTIPYTKTCTMYTTLEPCLMCTGALLMARIARVVWAVNDDKNGALRNLQNGSLYSELFASLILTPTPEPDIAHRIIALMETWHLNKGLFKARWC